MLMYNDQRCAPVYTLTRQVEKSRIPSSVQTSGQPEALRLMSHTQKTEL